MKTRILLHIALIFSLLMGPAMVFTGCANTPSTQSAKYKTLASVGYAAQAAMDSTTELLKAGKITVAQFQGVALAYDGTFQPAFRLAVNLAKADLSSEASPDIVALLAEFTGYVAQLSSK